MATKVRCSGTIQQRHVFFVCLCTWVWLPNETLDPWSPGLTTRIAERQMFIQSPGIFIATDSTPSGNDSKIDIRRIWTSLAGPLVPLTQPMRREALPNNGQL